MTVSGNRYCMVFYKAINGTTVGHDFLVFVLLNSPKICFCHLSGNPILCSDVQSKY